MKLTRHPSNPILSQNPVNSWEAGSVLNPSVLYDNGIFRMVYRATNDIRLDKKGKFMSSIGYAESTDGIHFTRFVEPIIVADKDYEKRFGCEDPRVTKINDTYILYYTAVGGERSGEGVRIALATSKDFKHWEKHGIVGPQFTYSKAGCLFPEKINGKYTMLYTWKAVSPLSSILMAQFETRMSLSLPKELWQTTLIIMKTMLSLNRQQMFFEEQKLALSQLKQKKVGYLFIAEQMFRIILSGQLMQLYLILLIPERF